MLWGLDEANHLTQVHPGHGGSCFLEGCLNPITPWAISLVIGVAPNWPVMSVFNFSEALNCGGDWIRYSGTGCEQGVVPLKPLCGEHWKNKTSSAGCVERVVHTDAVCFVMLPIIVIIFEIVS
jgi:hypothetical protein